MGSGFARRVTSWLKNAGSDRAQRSCEQRQHLLQEASPHSTLNQPGRSNADFMLGLLTSFLGVKKSRARQSIKLIKYII
jgi:hypothetical protein